MSSETVVVYCSLSAPTERDEYDALRTLETTLSRWLGRAARLGNEGHDDDSLICRVCVDVAELSALQTSIAREAASPEGLVILRDAEIGDWSFTAHPGVEPLCYLDNWDDYKGVGQ